MSQYNPDFHSRLLEVYKIVEESKNSQLTQDHGLTDNRARKSLAPMIFRVVDDRGNPVAGAAISVPHTVPPQELKTGTDGTCSVEVSGPMEHGLGIYVELAGFVPLRVILQSPPEAYTLQLEPAVTIGGPHSRRERRSDCEWDSHPEFMDAAQRRWDCRYCGSYLQSRDRGGRSGDLAFRWSARRRQEYKLSAEASGFC